MLQLLSNPAMKPITSSRNATNMSHEHPGEVEPHLIGSLVPRDTVLQVRNRCATIWLHGPDTFSACHAAVLRGCRHCADAGSNGLTALQACDRSLLTRSLLFLRWYARRMVFPPCYTPGWRCKHSQDRLQIWFAHYALTMVGYPYTPGMSTASLQRCFWSSRWTAA